MATATTADIRCPDCQGEEFELRLLKDEGVGTAKCLRCARDYLILDSADYWFDVIQQGYPRASRCACKSTSFGLRFEYSYRDGGEVRCIVVCSACSRCGKTKRQMHLEIDYGGTENLVRQPLAFCATPRILYD